MKYKITNYKVSLNDEEVIADSTSYKLDNPPELELLQKEVGGYIELVPEAYYLESNRDWFAKKHNVENVDAVWCHEEALLTDMPIANPFFIPAPWGDSLYGNVTVVEKVK